MNHLRNLFILTLLFMGGTACTNNEIVVPEPLTVDTQREYVATNVYSGKIYMGTNRGWVSDSAVVRAFIDRLKASGKPYPFRRLQTDGAPEVQQRLFFDGDSAFLVQNSDSTKYTHQVVQTVNNSSILWLVATQDSIYEAKKRPEAIINRLGLYAPESYTTAPLDPVTPEADIRVTTKPEQYFVLSENQLQAPGITYYLKTSNDTISGYKNNFLSETFFTELLVGDTVLIQGYRVDFK